MARQEVGDNMSTNQQPEEGQGRVFTRRGFLRLLGGGVAAAVVPSFVAACAPQENTPPSPTPELPEDRVRFSFELYQPSLGGNNLFEVAKQALGQEVTVIKQFKAIDDSNQQELVNFYLAEGTDNFAYVIFDKEDQGQSQHLVQQVITNSQIKSLDYVYPPTHEGYALIHKQLGYNEGDTVAPFIDALVKVPGVPLARAQGESDDQLTKRVLDLMTSNPTLKAALAKDSIDSQQVVSIELTDPLNQKRVIIKTSPKDSQLAIFMGGLIKEATPTPVTPAATVQPTAPPTPEAIDTPATTATVPATKAPEATKTPALSELLKQAPQIEGLKAELNNNNQVIYRAEKGNKWGLKEGEIAGRVVNYKLARGINLLDSSAVQSAQTESELGLALHTQIVKQLYLAANTTANLSQDKWAVPFNFDPKDKQFTIYEGESTGIKYLGINFDPLESMVGLQLVSPFPGSAESQFDRIKISTHPPKNLTPLNIENWTLSLVIASFDTSLTANLFKPVDYDSTLATVKSANFVNEGVCKNIQVGLLIGSKAGPKSFGLENILEYKNNGSYKVFMMGK